MISLHTQTVTCDLCVCVQARVNDQVVGYRDLAALPRDKAILQVERPDLMTYQPHLSFSPLDPPRREVQLHLITAIMQVLLVINQSERHYNLLQPALCISRLVL